MSVCMSVSVPVSVPVSMSVSHLLELVGRVGVAEA